MTAKDANAVRSFVKVRFLTRYKVLSGTLFCEIRCFQASLFCQKFPKIGINMQALHSLCGLTIDRLKVMYQLHNPRYSAIIRVLAGRKET
ncbi:hypothetical protein J6590_079239, partial [Homalodisca vitripennis]